MGGDVGVVAGLSLGEDIWVVAGPEMFVWLFESGM